MGVQGKGTLYVLSGGDGVGREREGSLESVIPQVSDEDGQKELESMSKGTK